MDAPGFAERDLEALLELSEALSRPSDIEGTLLRIAGLMVDALRADRCSVLLLDRDRKTGFVIAASEAPNLERLRIDLDRYPEVQKAALDGQPLTVRDVGEDPLFDSVRDEIRHIELGSMVLFPVSVNDEVLAILHLRTEDKRPEGLLPREMRFGRIVANPTGIALRNARMFHDIRDRSERMASERRKIERRLAQIDKYRRFFDLAGDGLLIIDARARVLFANRAALRLLGFEEAALSTLTLFDLVDEPGRLGLQNLMDEVRQNRFPEDVEIPVLRSSGEVAIMSLTTSGLDDVTEDNDSSIARGELTIIVSFRDVTRTRAIQEELRRTKDFMENLIRSSPDAIVAVDTGGRILVFNEVAQRITGYTEAEAQNLRVDRLYPRGAARQVLAELRSAGSMGRIDERRENLVTKSGEEVPVNLAAALVFDQDGQERAMVGIFSDLRERLLMEERLREAQQKVAVAETAGAVAHELNQPLTSIMGYAELLQRKMSEEDPGRRYLDLVVEQAERLATIVSKLSSITRYRTKPYVGETEILDLDAASTDEEMRK